MTLLPTPKGSDGPNGGPGMRNGRGVPDALTGVAALLPTPVGTDAHGTRNSTANRTPGSTANIGDTLGDIVHRADFGPYAPAVHRWEAILGRPVPAPTQPTGQDGRARLSPAFVEWLMGLDAGHVTDPAIGLTYSQQLKALGNGVVPQQAAEALRWLLGGPTGGVDDQVELLGTPTAHERTHTPRQVDHGMQLANQVALLPTAVNDGKTVQAWDEWTAAQKAKRGNGNGHGPSLAVEALRLGEAT